ncbi:uncharacterized protein EI90DRAFT_3049985 [Cantharellus anzutake]|uniref:uncharacterized protein n=1 Tax=Cantharellus anzutake TaxID=1750568 RepID=UPI00190849B8|nr:uncharacterized protein EI90DRAFT_3049985 [Cantharellus anzutake]KAF8334726.1 hypothetical protein EI90DRAFT_3049985 [Cantharellus anzutake]
MLTRLVSHRRSAWAATLVPVRIGSPMPMVPVVCWQSVQYCRCGEIETHDIRLFVSICVAHDDRTSVYPCPGYLRCLLAEERGIFRMVTALRYLPHCSYI